MFVYIMSNSRPTLYIGVTNNLFRRVSEHKQETIGGFTKKYHLRNLVYYEIVDGSLNAIIREKRLKDMNRADKLKLIRDFNPKFKDIYGNLLDT